MNAILSVLVALALAASLAAAVLLYTLDFPNLGTDHIAINVIALSQDDLLAAETHDYMISATTCSDRTVSTIVDLTDEEARGVCKAAWALGLAHSQECDPTLEVLRADA